MKSYTTIQGDTWDLVACKVFPKTKGENLTTLLIENNPAFINTVIFPAGCVLVIPDVDDQVSGTLPPWMY